MIFIAQIVSAFELLASSYGLKVVPLFHVDGGQQQMGLLVKGVSTQHFLQLVAGLFEVLCVFGVAV